MSFRVSGADDSSVGVSRVAEVEAPSVGVSHMAEVEAPELSPPTDGCMGAITT